MTLARVLPRGTMTIGRRRRSDLEVLRDVLRAVREESLKTRIMYRANLSPAMTRRYLDQLRDGGYVGAADEGFALTPRGHQLLATLAGVTRAVDELAGSGRGLVGAARALEGRAGDGVAQIG